MVNSETTDQWATDGYVVWPLNDVREHEIDNPNCECGAWFDGSLLVHDAFDERQKYERGERKMS